MTRFLPIVLVWLTATSSAVAHRLYVEAAVRPGPPPVLRIEAWFEGDVPAESAKITLTDAAGTILEAGTADDTGTLTIPMPAAGVWTVAAESIGHRGEFTLIVATAAEAVEEPAQVRPTGPEAWRIAAGLGMIAAAFAGLRWRMRRHSTLASRTGGIGLRPRPPANHYNPVGVEGRDLTRQTLRDSLRSEVQKTEKKSE